MALTGTGRGTGASNSTTSPNTTTTYAITPASNLTAGALAVLCVAADNSASSGSSNNINSVTDTKGNTWTKRCSTLYDNGAASAGAQGAIFTTSQNGGALTTGDTITVTFGATTTAKAYTLQEFTGSVGTANYKNQSAGTGATTASPSLTTPSVPNASAVVAFVAIEAGTELTCTQDGDTTNGSWSTQQYSEVGSTTSGCCIASQYKVVTSTATQTYNPTLNNSSDLVCGCIIVGEDITVTPGVLAATTTSYASTVTATQNVRVTPSTLALADTQYAPTTLTPRTSVPAVAALVLAAFAPTVALGAPVVVTPSTASLATAAYAPTVLAPRVCVPGVLALLDTQYTPTVLTPRVVVPGAMGASALPPVTSGLTFYGDATDQAYYTLVSGAYSELRDKAGSARKFVQGTAGSRPTQVDDGGLCMDFDGTDDYLESDTEWNNYITQSWTVIAQVSIGSSEVLWQFSSEHARDQIVATSKKFMGVSTSRDNDDDSIVIEPWIRDSAWNNDGVAVDGQVPLSTWVRIASRADHVDTEGAVRVDDNALVSNGAMAAADTYVDPGTYMRIGRNEAIGYSDFRVRKVLIYNDALTDTQIDEVMDWLAGAAGVKLTPYAPATRLDKIAAPPAASLTLTGYTPTVTGGGGVTVTPPAAALALAGYAATVQTPRVCTPPSASLALTGYATTILTPAVVIPPAAALTTTRYAPSVLAPRTVTPAPAALAMAGYAPAALTPRVSGPPAASLTLSSYAPTVLAPRVCLPPAASLTTTGYAPTVTANAGITVTPSTASLGTVTFAPTVLTPRVTVPTTLALVTTGFPPVITRIVVPSTASLTLATFAPTVLAPRVAVPATATLALTGYASTIGSAATAVPATGALTTTRYAPTVTIALNTLAVPLAATLAVAGYAPTVTVASIPQSPRPSKQLPAWAQNGLRDSLPRGFWKRWL